MDALVGYTGFVGSNIYRKGQIDRAYNSKNISEAYGTRPRLLIYAGLRAEKYLAAKEPDKDLQEIYQAEENIRKIRPERLVLISTVDVFKDPVGVDEGSKVDVAGLHAYGLHRYQMECWVRQEYPGALVVRLPALFGENIKKNFIYDFINRIPAMLKKEKMEEFASRDSGLPEWYELQDNGFYKCKDLSEDGKRILRRKFGQLGFTALDFTDSRSIFQFYPLYRLWDDIQIALKNDIRLLHLATEPVSAGGLYRYLTGRGFQNELQPVPARYDYRTVYDRLYGGKDSYIMDKETVKEQIRQFVLRYGGSEVLGNEAVDI